MGIEKSTEKQPIERSQSAGKFSFGDANLIQADLIRRSGIDPLQWVDKNAAAFREILESNPELPNLFRRNPREAEELIERQLKKRTLH